MGLNKEKILLQADLDQSLEGLRRNLEDIRRLKDLLCQRPRESLTKAVLLTRMCVRAIWLQLETNPPSPMRERVDELLSLMLTTKRENTEEWMEYLVEQMNRHLEELRDEDRVIYKHGEIYKAPRVTQ